MTEIRRLSQGDIEAYLSAQMPKPIGDRHILSYDEADPQQMGYLLPLIDIVPPELWREYGQGLITFFQMVIPLTKISGVGSQKLNDYETSIAIVLNDARGLQKPPLAENDYDKTDLVWMIIDGLRELAKTIPD